MRRLPAGVAAVAVASLLVACGGPAQAPPADHPRLAHGHWNHPFGAAGRFVSFERAAAVGGLTFVPVAPDLGVPPTHVEVLAHPARDPQPSRDNGVNLMYRLPLSWGFARDDTRVVINENGNVLSPEDFAKFAHDNGTVVDLGEGVQGALLEGPHRGATVARIVWMDGDMRGDVAGPAATREVVLRIARAVVSAS